MEDGAKENTALNIQKPLEILVTDEDKHGTDIACMSDFFGIYIEQLSAELSNQVMRGVVEKIPAADVQILGELVHGVDVLLSGKYGYIPDFDSLPNDVKDKLKKGIYTLGESRQVEDNVRAVVLDENGTRIKDVTLKRVLNTPDTLEMSRSITSQVQMRQIAAKLDEIAETQSYLIEMERNNNIIKPFLNARDLILRAQNAKTIDERKHYMIEASKELNDVINASRLDLKTSSEHLAKLTRFPILRNSSQIKNYMGYVAQDLQLTTKYVGVQMHVLDYLGDYETANEVLSSYQMMLYMEIHELQQLLSEMSLQEKIGQMVQLTGAYFDKEAVLTGVVGEQLPPEWIIQYAGSVLGVIGKDKIYDIQSRYMEQHPHHIPLLFMADVIHGCRTIAPIPLGQACSFHPELVSEAASIAASEASSEGLRATFSPMIDVSRDPRWGRMMESFGEDPYVNGIMGKAMVDGYQQKADTGIAACLKHFAGYGAVNAGREYNDVEISQRTFLEQYVKPFRMALKAKPAMVMTAFNAIDRKPISGNKELLKGLLRDKEGFEGTVISDWGSIGQLEEQGVAADMEEAAIQASEAGVDIDMMSPAYMLCLEKLVESGKIPEAFVDESAFRVLMMKNQLGIFENPFAGLGKSGKLTLHNREKAYQLAGESCVLLKNDKILPLSMKKKVIWAGPYTTSRELLSRWSIFGEHEAVETIEDVLQKKQIEVECITGCNILSDAECKVWQGEQELSGKPRDEQWLETITHEDTVVCVLGEHESQSGEAASRAFLTLPEEQQVLFEKIAERTSNIVTVVIAGRPLDLRRISEKSKAVIMAWRPGTMGAEAIIDIVYGRINPSGKLSVSIPWCVGQVPISYWDVKTGHILTEDNSENRFTSRYMDIPNTPLYPFGYGLSYTEFDISDVDVQIGQDKKVHVHCNVCNTGNVAGAEVVQCYYETLYASVVRPKKELVRFQKVFLKPGEKKDVDFFIDQEEFSYYGKNMETVSSGMKLRISIGNSSDHLVSENIIQE